MSRRLAAKERLAKAVRDRGSYRAAAVGLSAHFTHLHKIVQGKREPEIGLAVVFEQRLGIAVEEWPSLREPVKELLRLRGVAA